MTVPATAGVVLAIIDGGNWSNAFGLSLLDLQLYDAAGSKHLVRPEGGGYMHMRAATGGVAAARNNCMANLLDRSTADYVLFIDTDMGFERTVVEQLVCTAEATGAAAVTGLIFGLKPDGPPPPMRAGRFKIQPMIFQWANLAARGDAPAEAGFAPLLAYPRNELVEVDGCGAACLLVSRATAQAIRDRWGDNWFTPTVHPTAAPGGGPRAFSEDLSFCARVRELGLLIVADTAVKTTHDKGGVWCDEGSYDRQRNLAALERSTMADPPPANTACVLSCDPTAGTHGDGCATGLLAALPEAPVAANA